MKAPAALALATVAALVVVDASTGWMAASSTAGWACVARLESPQPIGFGHFGHAVALVDDRVIVGEPGTHLGGASSGAVHVFDRDGDHQQSVAPPAPDAYRWGGSIAHADGRVVIGGHYAILAAEPFVASIHDAKLTTLDVVPAIRGWLGGQAPAVAASSDWAAIGLAHSLHDHASDGNLEGAVRLVGPSGAPVDLTADRENHVFGRAVALSDHHVWVAQTSAGGEHTVEIFEVPGGKHVGSLSRPDTHRFGEGLAAAGDLLVAGADDTVWGLDAATGETRWQASKPDRGDSNEFGTQLWIDDEQVFVAHGMRTSYATLTGPSRHVLTILDAATGQLEAVVEPPGAARNGFGFAADADGPLMVVGAPLDGTGPPEVGAAFLYRWHEAQTPPSPECVRQQPSVPCDAMDDWDGDGLSRQQEARAESHPCKRDYDRDMLPDTIEVALGTQPMAPDSDGDGIRDGHEVVVYETNPRRRDTDGDLAQDLAEVQAGTDPRDPTSFPLPAAV